MNAEECDENSLFLDNGYNRYGHTLSTNPNTIIDKLQYDGYTDDDSQDVGSSDCFEENDYKKNFMTRYKSNLTDK